MLPILICVTLPKVAKVTVLSVFMKKIANVHEHLQSFLMNMTAAVTLLLLALSTLGDTAQYYQF